MYSKQLFAVGLVLIGLGAPRWIDAMEIAYRLHIARDVGVLPWYIVTAVGVILFLWHLRPRSHWPGEESRTSFRPVLLALGSGVITVLLAFSAVLLLGRELVDQVVASGAKTTWLAVRGLVLFAGGIGVVIGSACSSAARRH